MVRSPVWWSLMAPKVLKLMLYPLVILLVLTVLCLLLTIALYVWGMTR